MLLESYLKDLHLPGFLRNYRKFGEDAIQAGLGYDRYLLALAEQEIAQRKDNRQVRLIKAARFPVLKELVDFDFGCVPSLSKQRVLELAQGSYIRQAEPIFEVGPKVKTTKWPKEVKLLCRYGVAGACEVRLCRSLV